MQCPDCGHTNVPGSLFCERCGADLAEATPAPEPAPPTEAEPSAEAGGGEALAEPAEASAQPAEPTAAPAEPVLDAPPTAEPQVVCPACGHGNEPGFRICESCGESLAAADEAAPAPAPAVSGGEASGAEEPPARRIETPRAVGEAPRPAPAEEPGTRATAAGVATPGGLVTGPQRGKTKLVVEQGLVVGKQFLLNSDEMLVGREDASEDIFPDLDMTGLDEGYVHRRHARLTFDGPFLFVTHLGGRNRTYVNNRPIADQLAHPLNIGDTVRFGKVVLRVVEA